MGLRTRYLEPGSGGSEAVVSIDQRLMSVFVLFRLLLSRRREVEADICHRGLVWVNKFSGARTGSRALVAGKRRPVSLRSTAAATS